MGFAALALLVAASTASAQRRSSAASLSYPLELGMDGAAAFDLSVPANSAKTARIGLPVGNLRLGFYTSDVWEIEPFFALNYAKVEGFPGFTAYQFGSGVLYHFSPSRMQSQLYVRPFVGVVGASGGGNSNSDVLIGAGVGMKWPKLGGRIAWRGEGNISTTGDVTSLGLLWGLSYYPR